MIMKTASRALVWLSTTSKACVGRVDGVWDVSDSLERPSGPTAAERARGSDDTVTLAVSQEDANQ